MGTGWKFAALALLVGAMCGCGDDKAAGPEPAQITGLWNATKVEYVSRPAGESVDLVALGGSGTLTLGESNAFLLVITPFAEIPQTTEGTWALDGDTLELTPLGMPFSWQFDVALAGDSLGLSGASVEYDFNDDGTPDQATLNLSLAR